MQLSFDFDFPKPERVSFWRSVGYEPKANEMARIDVCVSFCETLGRNSYCQYMRVKILDINNGVARCETTEEWQNACKRAGVEDAFNSAGTIWIVDVADLAPVFNRRKM